MKRTFRVRVWGEQPHLGYNTYGGYDIAAGEWWRCFRLPFRRWLWFYWRFW